MPTLRSLAGRALRRAGILPDPAAGFTATQLDQLRGMSHQLIDPVAAKVDELVTASTPPAPDVLAEYCTELPSPQTAVDTFRGDWASQLPAPFEGVRAGAAPLFTIEHVPWGVEVLGGVKGQRVFELGPLEGGHTYLLDRMGVGEVVAVEANRKAFLKCLVTKELLGVPSARFLCGDALRYLEHHLAFGGEPFDLCLASGVLYHFVDPVAALDLMTRSSDRLLLWTHYYDEDTVGSREQLRVKFGDPVAADHGGFAHTLHPYFYQGALAWGGFCGGSAASSAWLSRAEILGAIEHFGFEVVDIGFEEADHKGNGPCICVAARRRR